MTGRILKGKGDFLPYSFRLFFCFLVTPPVYSLFLFLQDFTHPYTQNTPPVHKHRARIHYLLLLRGISMNHSVEDKLLDSLFLHLSNKLFALHSAISLPVPFSPFPSHTHLHAHFLFFLYYFLLHFLPLFNFFWLSKKQDPALAPSFNNGLCGL